MTTAEGKMNAFIDDHNHHHHDVFIKLFHST